MLSTETSLIPRNAGHFEEAVIDLQDPSRSPSGTSSSSFSLRFVNSNGESVDLTASVGWEIYGGFPNHLSMQWEGGTTSNYKLYLNNYSNLPDPAVEFGKLVIGNFDPSNQRQVEQLRGDLEKLVRTLNVEAASGFNEEGWHKVRISDPVNI